MRAFAWVAAVCTCVFAAVLISEIIERYVKTPEPELVAADAQQAQLDPLREFILQQEQLRSLQLTTLDEIVNSDDTSQAIRDSAQEEKLKILARLDTERTVSGILRARGYSDAACSMGDGYITVMVRAAELGEADVSRITGLIISQTSLKAENIKIIPIN